MIHSHNTAEWHTDRPRDLRIVFFLVRIESNRPYTTQAVRQPNGLQPVTLTANIKSIGILYLSRTRVMYGLRNSELSTCLFQLSHKMRQTMLLYAYFTPKVDFKRKFNHHQSSLYEWRLTARTIRKFRIGPSIRIESRSYAGPYCQVTFALGRTV